MSSNYILTTKAREALNGNWADVLLISFIFLTICAFLLCTCFGTLFIWPLCIGWNMMFLRVIRYDHDFRDIKYLFTAFNSGKQLVSSMVAGLIMSIIISIGYIFFIIPGIYFSCRYAMTFFVIADDDNINAGDAMQRSAAIMQGKIWKFFCLNLRFIGWKLLCILTFGIGYLLLAPYMQCSYAAFYDEAKTEYDSRKAGEAFRGA